MLVLPEGAGLGVRRGLLKSLLNTESAHLGSMLDFMEVTPDNWIGTSGAATRQLHQLTERFPFFAHGLSLSLGGTDPLDVEFIAQLKSFLSLHNIHCYSEHLSYCSADGHLYDLMPIPFTEEAVKNSAARIRQVQDVLGRRIAIENVSYYAAPFQELSEIDFVNAVIKEADCDLLLDVNNVYVNSINHGYDPEKFIAALPCDRVAYLHIAGHYVEAEDLCVDTHAAEVCDPVWELLAFTYQHTGIKPTLLERDFNFPPIEVLLAEVQKIRDIQHVEKSRVS
ncbi:MAG TPA: DUF692 domain-containing protein [Pseudomonadales bacterium]|nr:DUF692 domain-containing protein [Pseudomonadales bacterium]